MKAVSEGDNYNMNKNSRTKNSVINIITGFGGQLLSTILHFIVRTVFIYTLGKAYLGINGLFTNILSMLSLADLGVGSAIAFRLYKPLAENDEKRVRILVKFYKLAYKVIGVVIFLLGVLLIPLLPKLIKDYDTLEGLGINAILLYIIFLMQSVSSYLFLAYRSTVVTADQKKYILDLVNYVVKITTCIIQIIILVLFKSFLVYTMTAVFTAIANSLINGIIAKKKYPQFFLPEKESLSKAEIKEMFQDCGALLVYKINTVVVKASDNLVLSTFIGIAVVGMYSNYLLLYRTFADLIKRVFSAFKASMGNLFATESIEIRYRFFKIVNLMTALLFGTAGVGIAVCGNEVIETWLGVDYVLAQPVPILIGVELFFAGILVNLGQVRSVSGIFRQAWYRPLIGIIVNIVVSVTLVNVWGISGVIMGTIAAYVLTNFLIEPALIYKYAFNNFKSVLDYYKRNVGYFLVCSIVATFDLAICSHVFVGHGWLSVVIHVMFTGLSVPAAFAILFWKTEEFKYFTRRVKNIAVQLFRIVKEHFSRKR